jgi:uncharacterized membrane protein
MSDQTSASAPAHTPVGDTLSHLGDSLHHLGDSLEHLHLPHGPHRKYQSVVRDVNAEHQAEMGALDRLALKINDVCGSMITFLVVAGYEVLWILAVAIGLLKADSLPNLPLLLVILNLPQLPLMFALMVSGNMLNRHSELRAEADFEVNKKAEAQIEHLLEITHYQTEQILTIVRKLEELHGGSPHTAAIPAAEAGREG